MVYAEISRLFRGCRVKKGCLHRYLLMRIRYAHNISVVTGEGKGDIVSDHRAPHFAAIGPAHVQKYASPSRLPQPAARCDRLFRGYLSFVGLPRDWLPAL